MSPEGPEGGTLNTVFIPTGAEDEVSSTRRNQPVAPLEVVSDYSFIPRLHARESWDVGHLEPFMEQPKQEVLESFTVREVRKEDATTKSARCSVPFVRRNLIESVGCFALIAAIEAAFRKAHGQKPSKHRNLFHIFHRGIFFAVSRSCLSCLLNSTPTLACFFPLSLSQPSSPVHNDVEFIQLVTIRVHVADVFVCSIHSFAHAHCIMTQRQDTPRFVWACRKEAIPALSQHAKKTERKEDGEDGMRKVPRILQLSCDVQQTRIYILWVCILFCVYFLM